MFGTFNQDDGCLSPGVEIISCEPLLKGDGLCGKPSGDYGGSGK